MVNTDAHRQDVSAQDPHPVSRMLAAAAFTGYTQNQNRHLVLGLVLVHIHMHMHSQPVAGAARG